MKKIIIVIVAVVMSATYSAKAQVAINKDGSQPNAYSILHVKGDVTNFNILLEPGVAGGVGIGTDDPDYKLTIQSDANGNALRLIGTKGDYGHGAILSFGDGHYAEIREEGDDSLTIHAYERTAITGGNVGIGTGDPNGSAKLDIQSTHQGLLIPRMTEALRDNISSPATGLMVFVTNDSSFYYYEGSAWKAMSTDVEKIDDLVDGKSDENGNSIFLGVDAGKNSSVNTMNIGIGYQALYSDTSGYGNVANGYKTLYSNITGSNNVANGLQALYHNTTGWNNTANGYFALSSNTTGSDNYANGLLSLGKNTTGSDNVANGLQALNENTTGSNNIAFGVYTLFDNINGNSNIAVGSFSLQNHITGNDNIAIGYSTLNKDTTGINNVAVGSYTLDRHLSGEGNAAFGAYALHYDTIGNNNTALGYFSFYQTGINYSNSMALGYDSYIDASNQVRIGNSSVNDIGGYANWTNLSDGRFKKDVEENIPGISLVMKLRPVTYHLDLDALAKFQNTPDSLRVYESEQKKSAELQIGFIAQEVEQAATEEGFDFHAVNKPQNEGGHYGLRYAEFVPVLVKAVQEQQDIIDQQKELLNQQQKMIFDLQDRVEKLEK